ncbi:Siderophore iron transporter mirA [Verticillium dahliae VDG2]|nr:Siderophore iron transporter mirA [Verticillium dahliae VDG2]
MVPFQGHLLPPCPRKSASIQALILDTFQDYSLNAPRPSQLQLLIRLNVLDGLARNAEALGFPVKGLCADEFISPFNYQNGHRPSSQPSHPESLSPTALQRTVRHHPWVDLFPLARLRDNILRGLDSGTIDEDELCSDLLNVEDTNWSDASAAFLRKWGWITQGCPELIEGINYWRRIRGEQGIVFDVSDDGASTMATVNLVSALSESRT